MTERPLSSVTTILAYLVGRSPVSAITQTPASGPFDPVTTPPISVAPMLTAGCCARAGSMANAATAADSIALRQMFSIFISSPEMTAGDPVGRPAEQGHLPHKPGMIQERSLCIRAQHLFAPGRP